MYQLELLNIFLLWRAVHGGSIRSSFHSLHAWAVHHFYCSYANAARESRLDRLVSTQQKNTLEDIIKPILFIPNEIFISLSKNLLFVN